MTRRCDHVRSGHLCGRAARLRVGLAVPPHPPAITHCLCKGHTEEYRDLLSDEAREYLTIEELTA